MAGWLAVCCLALWTALPARGQNLQAPEYKLKAAFLYNFTKLVEWPENAFTNPTAPLVIGILGRDPFGRELDNFMTGRTVNGRKLQTVRFEQLAEVTNCHVLFISDSERRDLNPICETLRSKPILTVGDMKNFEAQGMIALVKTNETIDLRINLAAARAAGLQFSSRLTRLDENQRPQVGGPTNVPPAERR